MYRIVFTLIAAAAVAVPAAADPTKDDLDQALAKAKKDKKYLSVVFTLCNRGPCEAWESQVYGGPKVGRS